MSRLVRLLKVIARLILPVLLILVIGVFGASYYFLESVSKPRATRYLVTPEKYGMISTRGSKVTEETWENATGIKSRGWLLRGNPGFPGVILVHRYGADRSHMLDLGVKINESTNFTILMPDLRAHGESPAVVTTSFGACETDDVIAAMGFLRSLRTENGDLLVGKNIGAYGVELGAYVAFAASERDPGLKSLVLDSVPLDSEQLLRSVVTRSFPVGGSVTAKIANLGSYIYFANSCFSRRSLCEIAKHTSGRKILLLGGPDAPELQESTNQLAICFPDRSGIEQNTNLIPSGFGDTNASLEQSQNYDERVIDFFGRTLTE